jgi:hypothetical protein
MANANEYSPNTFTLHFFQLDHEARQCLPDCSGHGDFDLDTQKCVCKGQWTGRDCSKGNFLFNDRFNSLIFAF